MPITHNSPHYIDVQNQSDPIDIAEKILTIGQILHYKHLNVRRLSLVYALLMHPPYKHLTTPTASKTNLPMFWLFPVNFLIM